jgi:XRE family transcriptional regulator, regulator of sulfur utilization
MPKDESPLNLGKNVRQLRQARRLSQQQAAATAGLPRPTWANLESGSSNPTLGVLLKVAGVLQVSLEELISPPKAECRFFTAGELKTQRRGAASIRKILPDSIPGCELDRIEIPAGAHFVGVPHRPGTREYLTCETGKLRLVAGGESWELGPGDVVVFRGDQRHSYLNPGSAKAIGYSIVLLTP